ncbi:MAG TPA: helix-turn-helix domain-containing protein, partial [Candidatus Butyricicoccus avistercoris]|nr:helix-turn-helix domain-containing protein [Candidatus Butyricicoccus avistercoris]
MQKIAFVDIIKAQRRIFESVVLIMTTGEKIQNLHQQKGWSQERLGQELNLSRQSISKWESGTANPTVENLKELAK